MEKKVSSESNSNVIWDCGSSLYDSFELKSFEKQLRSALVSRTLSMPHLSDRRTPPPPPLKKKKQTSTTKISRAFQGLIRAVFKPKSSISNDNLSDEESKKRGIYAIPEFDEMSMARRSASARLTSAASLGIITCS